MILSCPRCSSKAFKRNGYTRHGKQNHRCLDCGRQFSIETQQDEVKENPLKFIGGFSPEGLYIETRDEDIQPDRL